jgi:cell division protein FtsW (lipid II flippase)
LVSLDVQPQSSSYKNVRLVLENILWRKKTFLCSQILVSEGTQVCQMAFSHTKNPNFDKFWKALERKILLYFMASWCILLLFGIFRCHFVVFWYILCFFGILFLVLVCCTKKNLATLNGSRRVRQAANALLLLA